MRLFILATISMAFIIFSCGKKVEEVNSDFIGFWNGQDSAKTYTIRIESDGQGRYSSMGGGQSTNAEGRVRYRNGNLRFGPFKSLEVETYPTLSSEGWIMKVEGIEYVKIQ